MDKTSSITPIFYVRGFNSPYTEGNIEIIRNMVRALSLHNIESIVFNYRYNVRELKNCRSFNPMKFEQSIPLVSRDDIFYGGIKSKILFSLSIEALATLKFLAIETYIKNRRCRPIVNIINCFRYPRIFLKRLSPLPTVLHFYVRSIPIENTTKLIVDKADAIITSSKTLADLVEKKYGVSKSKIKTVYPLLDTSVYRPVDKNQLREKMGLNKGARIILYMGNLRTSRFPEEIVLQTMKKLIKTDPETMLLIFSPRNHENIKRQAEIMAKARMLKLDPYVRTHVRDLSETEKSTVYSTSDIFLFPALSSKGAVEPPLTVLEAMSSGLVVITDGLLSMKEIITDGTNGLIASFRSADASHLEERISSILGDREAMLEMSHNARRDIVERMSLADSSKKIVETFESLLQ